MTNVFTGKKEELWAKADKDGNITVSLIDHMKSVGEVAEKLLSDSLYCDLKGDLQKWFGIPEENVIPLVKYLAAMHDIGKAHPKFQENKAVDFALPEEYRDSRESLTWYRHELGSEEICKRIWKENRFFDRRTIRFFSEIMKLHHQRKNNLGDCYSTEENWHVIQNDIEKHIREWSGVNTDMHINGDADAACTLVTAIIILCDWMASSGDAEEAFHVMRLAKAKTLTAKPFEEMFGFKPRAVQKELVEHLEGLKKMPLIATIEAPMGEGKTEIAIYMAYKMAEYYGKNGLYFALPTTATSNQMVSRVQNVVGEKTELIHSMSWLEDDEDIRNLTKEERNEYNKWKGPKKRAMLARYGVGTVDQLMTSVLRVRYGVLRILGLTNKAVIVDELHSYDAYMSTIISRLIDWCIDLKIPVVLLSATLPRARKKQMLKTDLLKETAYPLVTELFEDGGVIELPIKTVHKTSAVKIELANSIPDIPQKGCTLILANTVKKAVEIYENLPVVDNEKMLFHSRFTVARRAEIEKEVTRLFGKNGDRPDRMVLVATQVVEQSLDVDFDRMFTELAPIDLILQRIGRMHRHEIERPDGLENPICTVFAEQGLGTGQYIYYELLLEKTKRLLEETDVIRIPADIPVMIEKVYDDEPDEELIKQFFEREMDIEIQEGAARSMTLDEPDPMYFGFCGGDELCEDNDDFVNAKTRFGADTVQLCIVPEDIYEKVAKANEISASLAKELYQYCIPANRSFADVLSLNETIEGTGKLTGVTIVKGTSGHAPTDTLTAIGMRADKNAGLILEE